MTIKIRLFISNILMLIIPAAVGIIAAASTFAVCKSIIYRQVIAELAEKSSKLHMAEGFPTELLLSQYAIYDSFTEKTLIYSLCFLIIVLVVFSIIAANKFLTEFVFKKIELPINILVEGVNEIKNGNLNYSISYSENDEFFPVFDEFNAMTLRLKQSVEGDRKNEQNRKELIAGISHDIRTPLTAIKAYIEGLLEGVAKTEEQQQKYMKIIKQKADETDALIDKLFMFSKLDLGDYPFYPEKINLKTELKSIISECQDEYFSKGMNIFLADGAEGLTIYFDPVQFRTAIINILENSLKYKNKDTVNIKIYCTDLGDNIDLSLEDDGAGVSEDALDKLFDVFYRCNSSRNNPSKGSGLGLAITRKIIEHFGGSIRAENVSYGGLKTIITLPKEER